MQGSSADILDWARSREVTGVFHSRKTLDAAVQDLLVAGIDRADIDVSALLDELQRSLNYSRFLPRILPTIRAPLGNRLWEKMMWSIPTPSPAASPAALSQSLWRFISLVAALHRSLPGFFRL